MLSTSLRWLISLRSAIVPRRSAACQSTDAPSATDAARSASCSTLNVHLLGEAHERSRHCHSCCVRTCFAVTRGNLRVALLQLHAGDNQFPLFRSQTLQRAFIPCYGL